MVRLSMRGDMGVENTLTHRGPRLFRLRVAALSVYTVPVVGAPPSNPSHADTMGERRGFTLLGLVSTYLDGNLAYHAVKSALVCCDQVLVLEGPCGDPLQAEVPATYLGELADDPCVTVQTGRWRTDAKKRTAMVEWAHRHASGPTWGLWLDADEYLVNGEFLPDWLQYLTWMDERDDTPTMRQPLRLVELDGSISMSYVKLVQIGRAHD